VSRSRAAWAFVVLLGIVAISILHYTTTHEHGASPHHLYRRLYYVPILGAAFLFGLRGGLLAAALTIAAYVPHAFGLVAHADPASTVDKVAEILMYVGIGALAGFFVDRQRAVTRELRGLLGERDGALAELTETQEALVTAESQAALGHLTAGLAHEIRNPLGAIRGSAEILRDAFEPEDRHQRIAKRLVTETGRLDDVLTRFLRFAGREGPLREPADLSAVAEEVVELVSAEARQRGIELTWIRCTATPEALLDAGQIRQLLLNLVVNALQAQPDGGKVRVLSGVDDATSPGELFARVEDAGPGIPEQDRGRVFHPYYSGRDGGTGLGLALARRVATDHGGRLVLADSPLGGASFEFRVPLASDDG
jgi:two-component system, NtrC family, sensor histidine kinase HydH